MNFLSYYTMNRDILILSLEHLQWLLLKTAWSATMVTRWATGQFQNGLLYFN